MMHFSSTFVFFMLAISLAGCECGPKPPRTNADASHANDSGVEDGGAGDAGPARTVTGVRIEPPTAELLAENGAMPTQMFSAIMLYSDGTEAPARGPSFSIDNVSLGDLDAPSGLFAANGRIGGLATVSVTVPDGQGGPDHMAGAMLRVRLESTLISDGIADAPTRFAAATETDDEARSARVVYPLDGVVFPQNVYPADIQWLNSADGDLFRIRLEKPHALATVYVAHDGLAHWLVNTAVWNAIAQTDPSSAATVTVDRLEAASGEVIRGAPISMMFARAALTGSVYYWDIVAGRVQRIDDGSGTSVSLMPNPPPSPSTGERCVGCHSVSNSGRYMAGRLGGGENHGAIFDLTTDLTSNPAPTVWPINGSTQKWWFSSWSPDDSRLVITLRDAEASQRRLAFMDPLTGNLVTVSGTLPSGTQPAWAPDGTRIAYVANADDWGGEFTRGDLALVDVTGPDTVGASYVVHDGSSLPDGRADSYPTWSPDSSTLAFAHGTGARSERDTSSLYLMFTGGSVTHLSRASTPERLDYQPRFSPFAQGGYHWLSFLSRRVYGNPQIGNSTRPEGLRQQIWVTAIRIGASPGEEPSSVPYWLPGQNPRSANISAFWAPRPCRPDGDACAVGSECCGGDCRPPAGGGAPVCSPPPAERCRTSGETCTTTADCCADMNLSCIARVCVEAPG
jgi:hypothetical protein